MSDLEPDRLVAGCDGDSSSASDSDEDASSVDEESMPPPLLAELT